MFNLNCTPRKRNEKGTYIDFLMELCEEHVLRSAAVNFVLSVSKVHLRGRVQVEHQGLESIQ